MKMELSIVAVLMSRDGMSRNEAREELRCMKERVSQGEDPEDLLYDIGLEPDYIFDLI